MPMNRKRAAPRLAAALVLLAAFAVVAGCGDNNDANNAGDGVKAQHYSNDGYLGITSSYPGVPGRHMALNYNNDARMMRETIRGIPGIRGADIRFHGAQAYIALRLQPGLSRQQMTAAERQAASVLRFNFPRYTVYVRSAG